MQSFGDASATLGVILGALGAACVLGPMIANAITPPIPPAWRCSLVVGYSMLGVGYALMAVAHSIGPVLLATFIRSTGGDKQLCGSRPTLHCHNKQLVTHLGIPYMFSKLVLLSTSISITTSVILAARSFWQVLHQTTVPLIDITLWRHTFEITTVYHILLLLWSIVHACSLHHQLAMALLGS